MRLVLKHYRNWMSFISKFISAHGLNSSLQTKLKSAVFCISYSFVVNVSYISPYFSYTNPSPSGFKTASENKISDFRNTERMIEQQSETGKLEKESNVRPHPFLTHYSTSLVFDMGEMSPTTFQHLPLLKATDRLSLIHFQKPQQFFNNTRINNKKSKTKRV